MLWFIARAAESPGVRKDRYASHCQGDRDERRGGSDLPGKAVQDRRLYPPPRRFLYIDRMKMLLLFVALPLSSQAMMLADFPAGMPQADGWTWEYFSDRVMGGRSELVPPGITGAGGDRALRLSGTVNTKGGGFIQARIRREKGAVDASSWKGIEATIEARAGGAYFLHVRTSDNRMPWSYYGAPLAWPGGKATLRIPWSSFEGASAGRRELRPESLQSVALVAGEKDFQADLSIYRISFYKIGNCAGVSLCAGQPGAPPAVRIPGRAVEYSVLPSNSPLAVKTAFRDSGSLAKWS